MPRPNAPFPAALLALALCPAAIPARPSLAGQAIPFEPVAPGAGPATLRIRYRLDCGQAPSRSAHLVAGTVVLRDRRVRFELVDSKDEVEVDLGLLGAPADKVELELEPDPDCRLQELSPRIEARDASPPAEDPVARLALVHSPFIAARGDQLERRDTDLPLLLAYDLKPGPKGRRTLTYTVFFSDEDSRCSASDVEAWMTSDGRRTDIEWVYQVELDASGSVLHRRYQGGFIDLPAISGIGHLGHEFQGRFIPGTEHPILYNTTRHNVFSDSPDLRQRRFRALEGHHLVPRTEIPFPRAREWAMWQNPWIFRVSDWELEREGKLWRDSSEYLYVQLEASGVRGYVTAQLTLKDGWSVTSGSGEGAIARLDTSIWGRQVFTALPIGSRRIEGLLDGSLHGRLEFVSASLELLPSLRDLRELRLFRLVPEGPSYRAEEITSRVPRLRCRLDGMGSLCRF